MTDTPLGFPWNTRRVDHVCQIVGQGSCRALAWAAAGSALATSRTITPFAADWASSSRSTPGAPPNPRPCRPGAPRDTRGSSGHYAPPAFKIPSTHTTAAASAPARSRPAPPEPLPTPQPLRQTVRALLQLPVAHGLATRTRAPRAPALAAPCSEIARERTRSDTGASVAFHSQPRRSPAPSTTATRDAPRGPDTAPPAGRRVLRHPLDRRLLEQVRAYSNVP